MDSPHFVLPLNHLQILQAQPGSGELFLAWFNCDDAAGSRALAAGAPEAGPGQSGR